MQSTVATSGQAVPGNWFVRILSSVRFSVWPSQSESWEDLSTLVRYADDNDWYGVWLADHFMPSTYSSPSVTSNTEATSGPVIECLSVLAALAAVTSRVRLGSLVVGNTYRHPAILAKQATAIDRISGGRFVLGIGAGWQENEHLAYGVELPSVRDRLARFEEACADRALPARREPAQPLTVASTSCRDAPNDPKPVQRRLPLPGRRRRREGGSANRGQATAANGTPGDARGHEAQEPGPRPALRRGGTRPRGDLAFGPGPLPRR